MFGRSVRVRLGARDLDELRQKVVDPDARAFGHVEHEPLCDRSLFGREDKRPGEVVLMDERRPAASALDAGELDFALVGALEDGSQDGARTAVQERGTDDDAVERERSRRGDGPFERDPPGRQRDAGRGRNRRRVGHDLVAVVTVDPSAP